MCHTRVRRLRIKRAPPVLALHLKRFKMGDGQQNRYMKLSYRVSFPFEMRLFNYVCDPTHTVTLLCTADVLYCTHSLMPPPAPLFKYAAVDVYRPVASRLVPSPQPLVVFSNCTVRYSEYEYMYSISPYFLFLFLLGSRRT